MPIGVQTMPGYAYRCPDNEKGLFVGFRVYAKQVFDLGGVDTWSPCVRIRDSLEHFLPVAYFGYYLKIVEQDYFAKIICTHLDGLVHVQQIARPVLNCKSPFRCLTGFQ